MKQRQKGDEVDRMAKENEHETMNKNAIYAQTMNNQAHL